MGHNGFTTASAFSYDGAGRLTGVTYPSGAGNAGNGSTGVFTYDTHGDLASATWQGPGGVLITSDAVSRSNAGRYLDETVDGVSHAGLDFGYDGAGRLGSTFIPGLSATFWYAASNPCGTNAAAGKNTNRTLMGRIEGSNPQVNTTYCYDHADRLTSSSDPAVGTITYDSHGNTTAIFGETHTYDSADRHVSTTKGGTTVTYLRDARDRILRRSLNGVPDAGYVFGDIGDAPDGVVNASNVLTETNVSMPGGTLWTMRSSGNVWSYPNVHGDLVASANQSGLKQGATVTYDPFGNRVGAAPAIDNSAGSFDYGYLGQHQRPVETQATLQPTIEMGARQYSPLLGRFLEVDPMPGGCSSAYAYVDDPISQTDLSGMISQTDLSGMRCGKALNVFSAVFSVGG